MVVFEKIGIVCSLQDKASVNIANCLKEIGLCDWMSYYEFEEDSINLPLEKVSEEKIIVLSRHKSAANKKSFTVHSLGNFSKPDFGGEEKKLCCSMPKIQTNLLRGLEKNISKKRLAGFDVCFEVTHHGPYCGKKVCFVEIGSSEKEWSNKENGFLVAETIKENVFVENDDEIVIGIGGGHYAPDFSKLSLRKKYSFGHICPQYALKNLDEKLLEQMIKKTGAKKIVLDWKGLKKEKEKIVGLCKKTGKKIERVQKLLK